MIYHEMFSEIWIFIETVALIGMYCFLCWEIHNGTMQEEKRKAEAAVKDAEKKAEVAEKKVEDLEVIIRKMNEETYDIGFYFKVNNGRFDAYHTDEWYAKNKARLLEVDNLRKDRDHWDKMTDKMIKLAKKRNLEFEFKDGCCVALVQK